eukprot:TRINITY_DN15471_c0_g2_i1.p1 TRINITY_DN15471_c0_g2~~TRINITY_DN15471_c0_g2_i1.p1  ORF type:complete len:573 (+),score=133.09 TRINITY_DN15471_c0_g2_i1:142-1719(+)
MQVGEEDREPAVATARRRSKSPTTGDGMSEFIMKQITSILRPFADCIMELKEESTQQQAVIQKLKLRLESCEGRIEANREGLSKIRGNVAATKAHLQATKNDLDTLAREKAALEATTEDLRVATRQLEVGLRGSEARAAGLDRTVEALEARCDDLHAGHQDTRKNVIEEVLPMLRREQELCERLREQMHEQVQSLTATRALLDQEVCDTAVLRKALDRQQEEHGKRMKEAFDSLSGLKDAASSLGGRLNTVDEQQTSAATEVRGLRVACQQIRDEQRNSTLRADRSKSDFRALEERLAVFEKQATSMQELMLGMRSSSGAADEASPSRRAGFELQEQVRLQGEQIERIESAQRYQESVATKTAEDLKHLQVLHGALSRCQSDIRDVRKQASSTSGMLQEAAPLIQEARAQLHREGLRLDSVVSDIQEIRSNQQASSDVVARLRADIDGCHSHLSGLRQGFRETPVKVRGDQDALLPKTLRDTAARYSPILEPGSQNSPFFDKVAARPVTPRHMGTLAPIHSARGG